MESWATFSFFVHCEIILFTSSGSTNIQRWMVKQEYKFSFCKKKKKPLRDFQWLFFLFLLSDKRSEEICRKWCFLAFQKLEFDRADNSRMFVFLLSFEDGISLSLIPFIFTYIPSFEKKWNKELGLQLLLIWPEMG